MGKGDIKTGRGKRVNGSYGKTRKRKKSTNPVAPKKADAAEPKAVKEKTAPKKATTEKAVAEKKTTAAKKPATAKKAPKTTETTEE